MQVPRVCDRDRVFGHGIGDWGSCLKVKGSGVVGWGVWCEVWGCWVEIFLSQRIKLDAQLNPKPLVAFDLSHEPQTPNPRP